MKRLLIAVFATLILLSACGRQFTSMETEELYNRIEQLVGKKITLADESEIRELEERYNKLTKEQRAEVSNYDILEASGAELDQVKATINDLNEQIKIFSQDMPPEALEQIRLMWEQYEGLSEADRELVSGKDLEGLKNTAEEWYGKGSYYVQIQEAADRGDYEKAVALGADYMDNNPPQNVRKYGIAAITESLLMVARQYKDEGDLDGVLGLFDAQSFTAMAVSERKQFADIIISTATPKIKLLVQEKKYDEALAIMKEIPGGVQDAASSGLMAEIVILCYVEPARASYKAGKYQEAMEFCDLALARTLGSDTKNEMTEIWANCSIELANACMNRGEMGAAYKLLNEAKKPGLDSEVSARVNSAKDALLARTKPTSGQILSDTLGAGTNVFEVINETERDRLVWMEQKDDSTKYKMFFVAGKATVKIYVPDGTYRIKEMGGEDYVDTEVLFASGGFWNTESSTPTFETTYYAGGYQYTIITWTIRSLW